MHHYEFRVKIDSKIFKDTIESPLADLHVFGKEHTRNALTAIAYKYGVKPEKIELQHIIKVYKEPARANSVSTANHTKQPVAVEKAKAPADTLEEQNRKYELDLEAQRLRDDREREEEAQRMLKGQRLRDKGRPFAAWLTEINPLYTTTTALIVLSLFAMDGILPAVGTLITITVCFMLIREAVKKK